METFPALSSLFSFDDPAMSQSTSSDLCAGHDILESYFCCLRDNSDFDQMGGNYRHTQGSQNESNHSSKLSDCTSSIPHNRTALPYITDIHPINVHFSDDLLGKLGYFRNPWIWIGSVTVLEHAGDDDLQEQPGFSQNPQLSLV